MRCAAVTCGRNPVAETLWVQLTWVQGANRRVDEYQVGTAELARTLYNWGIDLVVAFKDHERPPQPPIPALFFEGKWS